MTPNPRAAYMDASVATASPARLLVMLYERLVLDITRAATPSAPATSRPPHPAAPRPGHRPGAARQPRVEEWEGGAGLASLYDYLHPSSSGPTSPRTPALVADTLALVDDLCRTWREAALTSVGAA